MKRLALLVLAVALLLTACGDDGGSDSATPGSTAKKIRTVTLMTHDSFSVSDDVLAAFERSTGYAVKVLKSGDAGQMVNQAVLTKDHPLADVLYGIDNTFLTRALDENVFEPYVAKGAGAVPAGLAIDTQGRVTPIDYGDVCLNYDRSYFTEDRTPPASLDDLIDPAFEDLTVVEDAALSSPGLAFLLATIDHSGSDGWEDYWSKLKANGVRVAKDWETAYYTDYSVSGGDRPIVVSYASSPPAEIVFAEEPVTEPASGVVDEGCFRQVEYAGVLDGAENVAGARALVDFMLTKQFQQDVPMQMFVFPVLPDAQLPPLFTKWAATPGDPATLDPETIGANRKEWIEQWSDIVGA